MPPTSRRSQGVAILVAFLALWSGVDRAHAAGVSIAPNRIVLEGRTFAATVYLTNRGTETTTYRIGISKLRMIQSGSIVPVSGDPLPGELFADELIRYSPRRCVIPPGGSQTVRLLVRRPRGSSPQAAEYRAHLSVKTTPEIPRLEELENRVEEPVASDNLSIRTIATVESLVPIIIRFGRLQATPGIENVEVVTGPEPRVDFSLTREGTRSLYGQIEFTYIDPKGDESEVGLMRGLAVYTPLETRDISYALELPDDVRLNGGNLRIAFEESPDGGGDQRAEITVPVGKRGTD